MDSDMNDRNDDVDKWPFRNIFRKGSKPKSSGTVPSKIVTLCGDKDSDEYFLKYPHMGKCIIFNHKTFNKWPARKGTDEDVLSLYSTFKKLGFNEIRTFRDFTVRQVIDKLTEVGLEDHSDNSCFVCCILTHGHNGILCAKDGTYPVNYLYEFFKGSVCSTLVGKPKLFFIQACQGDGNDPGVCVEESKESMDSRLKIPTYADFLIALSTFPGFVSYKNEVTGSYFIQYLCDVLDEHAQDKHLMDMLTIVNRKFAIQFESSNYKDASKDKKKQIPYITFTLTKNVKFSPVAVS